MSILKIVKNIINQLFTVFVVIKAVWKMFIRRKTSQEPPDLSGKHPILGHIGLLYGIDGKAVIDILQKVSQECIDKGGAVTAYASVKTFYVLTDPDDCLTVSNACLAKDKVYDVMESYLGNSLLTSDVKTWKVHRKLLNPAFNQNLMNSFLETFNRQASKLTEQLAAEVGTYCDVDQYVRLNALETICMTSLGCEKDLFQKLERQYIPYLKKLMEVYITRILSFWLLLKCFYQMTQHSQNEKYAAAKLNTFSDRIIEQKKKHMVSANLEDIKPGRAQPFMDLILKIAKETGCFTDEEIRMETNTIIFGGHDTSATVLTIALILIGSYPEVQRKVYEEILQVIGNTDREIDKDDLPKLVYIEAVLKESLRLYPVVMFSIRYINKDVQLKNYILKAKSSCVLLIWGIHRHPMWGADAEQFRPERWFEPSIPDAKYFAGFMMGKRSCIGKLYAMMSMKTTIAYVVRKFKISADISKLQLSLDILIKPSSADVKLELRK